MMARLKGSAQEILRGFGLEVRRSGQSNSHSRDSSPYAFDHTFERLEALRELGFSPKAILDGGASNGRWSLRCLEVFPEAQYFCVDPLLENEASLAQLSAKFPNVAYWMGCLGSATGKVTLNVDGDGSSVLAGHTGNSYGTQLEVPMKTIDGLVERGLCRWPELIKLDVQGYELQVLDGAEESLGTAQAILVEASCFPFQCGMPLLHEVIARLADNRFVVYDVLSLLPRPLDGALAQCDLLFLKVDHPVRQSNKWDLDSAY